MEGIVFAVDRLRQECDILVVGTEDNAMTLKFFEIFCRRQTCCYAERRGGNVGDIVCAVDEADTGVFDSEGFIFVGGRDGGGWVDLEVDTVFAACNCQM